MSISGYSKRGRTQTKLNGLQRDVLVTSLRNPFDATDESSRCLPSQAEIRRTMIVINRQFGKFSWFMLCRLTDVCHGPSEPPAKRTLGPWRRWTWTLAPRAAADRRARLSTTAFPTKSPSLSIISFEKASQVLEEKELDKRSSVKSCQASGEGEWSRVNQHEACTGVQVPTGTHLHWDARQTFFFFVRKSGEGGYRF